LGLREGWGGGSHRERRRSVGGSKTVGIITEKCPGGLEIKIKDLEKPERSSVRKRGFFEVPSGVLKVSYVYH